MDSALLPEDALQSWRKRAYDRWMALGGPQHAPFDYVPLSQLSLPTPALAPSVDAVCVAGHVLPECTHYLVFIDGFFLPEQSKTPPDLVVLPLDKALQTYGLFLQNRWAQGWKSEADPLSAWNGAFHGRGAFVYAPPGVQCTGPLQIVHILTGSATAVPRVQIVLGKQSSLTIVQTLSFPGCCNNAMDLSLDAGASLRLVDAQLLPTTTRSFLSLRATVKRDARLEAVHVTDGSQMVRFAASIELLEEHSSAAVRVLGMLSEERQAHVHAHIDHAAPHTESHQHVKMALNGRSRSSFAGKIFVRPVAQKTQAYQLNNNLLLSDAVTAYAKPGLEIFADDVKASHGATFAQLSEEQLLYLRSRGLSQPEARALLARGFCHSFIESIELPSLRALLLQSMQRVLHG